MYFKSVEMRGFKSFVDETKMEFEPGITAVVGPNGCGKSNIADALRWVLGEQSARLMRGAKMEDFIFTGSSNRKPAGFAEVSITISNTDGSISSHPYSEYEEITVTRKLYRTGESEYYINKVPCRLKDIVDIFLDTGINARSFSIIEQAQVSRIVNSKPDDRRFIIEEAAGVMKYKNRRNAAINKLEASQQNLLRIQDILGELERQRNSLNRQAKKAERFKAYKAEIKSRGLAHYADEYQKLAGELKESMDGLEEVREREAALAAELSARRNEAEVLNDEMAREEAALADLREQRSGILSKIERNDHHRELLSRQLQEITSSNEAAKEEIEVNEGEIEKIDGLIAERKVNIEELSGAIERNEAALAGLKEAAENLRRDLAAKREEGERIAREARDAMEKISAIHNSRSSYSAKVEMSEEKISSLSEREGEISARISTLEESLAAFKSELDGKKAEAEREREKNKEIRASLEMGEEALSSVEDELRSLEADITRSSSRLESLQELDRNLEGFGEGVRGLMKMKDEGAESAAGIIGLLADSVRAPEDMEAALAAALGARIEAVIMKDSYSSLEAINLLKRDRLGRASFVPADLAQGGAEGREPGEHPSLIGKALDVFTFDERLPKGAVALLKNTLIARDLEGAMEIWRRTPGVFTIVTVDGDVVDESGLVTAGAKESAEGAGIVARKRLIEELGASLEELDGKKLEVDEKRASLKNSVELERGRLEESERVSRSLEISILEISKEIQKEEADLSRSRSQMETLVKEREKANEEKERFARESAALEDELNEAKRRKEDLDGKSASLVSAMEEARVRLDESLGRAREEEVALAEIRGKRENFDLDIKRLEGSKADLVARVQRLKDSLRDFGARRDEMSRSIDSLAEENVELARSKDSITEKINEFSSLFEERVDKKEELEKKVKELAGELEKAREETSATSLRKSELEMRLENVVEKADHEFNIPVEDLRDADLADVDLEEAAQRLAFLRGELARIGDVNMSALEEFEEINERYEFMKNQQEDLIKSIATLRKTIDNINATTATMFNNTYKEVSENFERIFRRLFGGGRAEMRLVEEEGKTEPGLEIFVQPPGKKVQNLNLLSAGEKAMTAIALLFAVFMTRPSPFCLLDEVDAPLDEANIFRFRDMLMEMKEKTQFIIITHSQKTMSFAERLYGVTQEEEGVSKILAVNLSDRRREDLALSAA